MILSFQALLTAYWRTVYVYARSIRYAIDFSAVVRKGVRKLQRATQQEAMSNKASGKSRLNTICRLKPLVIFSVKLRNSFKRKYFRHFTRVLVQFPETKGMNNFTTPHFSRGKNVVHSSVERM